MENSAQKEWDALAEIAELIEPEARSREEFIEECKKGKFDKVKVAYRTFQSVAITGLVDEELVKALPEGLKFIAHNGIFSPWERNEWKGGKDGGLMR
jgi:glyoxylate reductase